MAYDKAFDPGSDRPLESAAPARYGFYPTLSDTVDMPVYAKSLKANIAGTIMVLPVENYRVNDLTPRKIVVVAGEYVPIQIARIFLTGTTLTSAGDILALAN